MRRRDFLRTGAAAAAGGAAWTLGAPAPAVEASARPGAVPAEDSTGTRVDGRRPGARMWPSCAAYSFRKELSGDSPKMSLEDFVDFCADQGLAATELTSYYFRRTDREYLLSLRRRAYVNGLAISGTPVGNDFCHPPGPRRDAELDKVKAWIDHVALLGSQTIRVFAGTVKKGTSEDQAREWCIEGLKAASAYAGERGVLLGLENHGGITATADQLLALVRGVDSPWLGVNLDTGNFHQDVYGSLEKVAPWAVSVQVKVETREQGEPAKPTDYGRIRKILTDSGYRGYVALEYEASEDARVAVPRHLAEMCSALGI